MGCAQTPQQAVGRKSPFNAAAMPPSRHASGVNFHWRKQNHADNPRNNNANGAKILENKVACATTPRVHESDGAALGSCLPSQFKSCHAPWSRGPGFAESELMAPSGPSLLKTVRSGANRPSRKRKT